MRPFQRFDPFNPEHVEWVKRNSKKDNANTEENNEDIKIKEENVAKSSVKSAPIVDERRFFNVDASFMQELREKTGMYLKLFNIYILKVF